MRDFANRPLPGGGEEVVIYTHSFESGVNSIAAPGPLTLVKVRPNVVADVQNAEPTVQIDTPSVSGQTVSVQGVYDDPGTLDTHTATIDWGDGTVEPLPLNPGARGGGFAATHAYSAGGDYTITIVVIDSDGGEGSASTTVSINVAQSAFVGAHLFADNSVFDGRNPGADPGDDAAIDLAKSALAMGETASFANYTGQLGGITGIMLDVAGLPAGIALTAADLDLRLGNVDDVCTWTAAPQPTIGIRRGAGVDGSDRVTLTWPSGTIERTWLMVRLLATAATGLAAPATVFFGTQPGETGNDPNRTIVNSLDVGAITSNYSGFTFVGPDNPYDLNRDRRVNSLDVGAVTSNYTGFSQTLRFITPFESCAGASMVVAGGHASPPHINSAGDSAGPADAANTPPTPGPSAELLTTREPDRSAVLLPPRTEFSSLFAQVAQSAREPIASLAADSDTSEPLVEVARIR